ncbi:MAG: polysaccharide biosynthesis tyrosine autokinase [Acidobacteriota bacterium]|nr:MAG: polysaccharide biosynthesis tyrosine autokinase [Acidobacteriota bacterium]
MQEELKNKLMTVEEAAAALDLKRDYGYAYARGMAVETESTHLRDYWRIIRRRLWVPISVVILTVTLTTIYNLRLPSIYEGRTSVEVLREDQTVNIKDVQISMAGGDDNSYINTQLKIMQSPKIAYLVARSLDLEHNPEFIPGMARPINSPSEEIEFSDGESDLQAGIQKLQPYIDTLLGNVEVRPVRETRLIEILYHHPVPDLARKIADTWAEAFIQNTLDERFKANKDSGKFLERTISNYKLRVKQAEEQLLNYRKANKVIDYGDKENTVVARLGALNQLLLQAENERKNAQLVYDLSKNVDDVTTLPEIQRDPLVQDLNKKLTDLKQQREQLLVEFTPEWPEVKKVTQQLSQVEGELRAAHQRISSTIENLYRTAAQREDSLRKSFNVQLGETMNQNEGAIMAKMLQQEIDTNRQMLERLMQSQQGVELSGAGLLKNNIRIAEMSSMPRSPVAPKRLQNILLSGLLALVAGVGLVLFLDYINNKLESVEDIDRYLRLPALGVIPLLENGAKSKRLIGGGGGRGKEMVPANGSVVLTQVEANSSIAESYRQLRTSLLLSSAGHAPRTILFTSSQPAEGKTTTSVNTAISLAQTGSAVLIIDADLRRPRVHKIFNLKNTAGLSNYLTGEEDLASLIQVAMPNLYVLPVGPLPPNPAELLGSVRMKQVIETLAANFDYVIVDSPPVSSFADSLILSSMVEGVIIVVKGGSTPRELAQRAKAHLQSVGARILGVVVNQIKLQPHDYYYYSSYYNRNYYGGGDEEEVESKK